MKLLSIRMILAFIIALGSLLNSAFGATRNFSHITANEGLPHQEVEALQFDRDGYLWVATRNGLARYDGYDMRVYQNAPDDTLSISHNFVTHLLSDSKGRVWVSTYMGMCRYNEDQDNFKRYPVSNSISSIIETSEGKILYADDYLHVYDEASDSFKRVDDEPDFILSMASSSDGTVFAITNNSLYSYDSTLSYRTRLSPDIYSSFLTGADGIAPMFVDSSDRLWIGRNGDGIMAVDLRTGDRKVIDYGDLKDAVVRTICEDQDHALWLGTESGLIILHPDGQTETLRQDFTNMASLNDNAVYSIACDAYNNIWTGTYFGGINVLLRHGAKFHTIHPGYDDFSLWGKAIRHIIEPRKGELWIATEDGGLNILDLSTSRVSRFTALPLGSNVHSLFNDAKRGEVWIGTFRNGLFRYRLSDGSYRHYEANDGSGLASDAIFDFAMPDGETLWVGTTIGLYRYDREADRFLPSGVPALDKEFIFGLKTVGKNSKADAAEMWIATRNRGVFRLNTVNGEATNWNANTNGGGLLDNYIPALLIDRSGSTWVGTNNFGVYKIDAGGREIRQVLDDPVLATSCICGFFEDKEGIIWITTSQGLIRYDPANGQTSRFTSYHGLPTNQFNFQSAVLASDGFIYMGTVNGLVKFDPKAISESTQPFEVRLHAFYSNGELVLPEEGGQLTKVIDRMECLTVSHEQANSLAFDYGVVYPGSAGNIRYQIMLEGRDANWRNVDHLRHFEVTNLPAGTYTLRIRANDSDNDWDEMPVKSLRIKVLPPFYATWWAYLIYFVLGAAVVWIGILLYRRRLRLIQEERLAAMEQEQAKKLNKAKMDFFTEASHELKTPLSLISAPLKKLAENTREASERQLLDMAIRNADKMVGFIDRLVTFNKMESGNFQFFLEKGNPMEFIAKFVGLFMETAKGKGIDLAVECEDNGEEVWFSPLYTEMIVNNLLSNALKFTHSGGAVRLRARIDQCEGATYLEIKVADTGIGIVKEEQDKIFRQFYQTGRGLNTNHKGWGIGLPLVKKLAEIHKGDVELESARGVGSTFTVRLKVDADAFPKECRIESDRMEVPLSEYSYSLPLKDISEDFLAQSAASGKPYMLVVEDEDDLRAFLSSMFGDFYNVTTASNGREALDMIAQGNSIDIIISDVMMPEMDGVAMCRTLKQDVATSHIPVILLTAKSGSDDVVEGYTVGAEAYVAKPFDPKALMLQVNNIMRISSQRRDLLLSKNGEAPLPEDCTLSDLDRDFITRLNALVDSRLDDSDLDVAYLTKELGLSRTSLYSKMRVLLGVSIGDYIRKKRMALAQAMLAKGHNVSETAYSTGFSDPSYFSKAFRKEFGVSPTEYVASLGKRNPQARD